MRAASAVALGIGAIACIAPSTFAEERPSRLDACVDVIGATDGGEVSLVARTFLGSGRSHVARLTSSEDCLTLLAVGGTEIRSLGLFVDTEHGEPVVEDFRGESWAAARVCGVEQRHLAVVVHVAQGQGEVRVLSLRGWSSEAVAATSWDGCANGAAGHPPEPPEPAAEPRRPVASDEFARRVRERGMRARVASRVRLRPGQAHRLRVPVAHGCIAVAAVARAPAEEVAATALDVAGHVVHAPARSTTGRDTIAWMCGGGGEAVVTVRRADVLDGARTFEVWIAEDAP